MKQPDSYKLSRQNGKEVLSWLLFTVFFSGLLFNFRAACSISIMLMMGFVFIDPKRTKDRLLEAPIATFIGALGLYFLLILLYYLFQVIQGTSTNDVQLKSGMIFTPLAVLACYPVHVRTRQRIIQSFVVLLLFACVFCLVINFKNYIAGQDDHVFFYHQLVRPLYQHAVYFSFYVLFALIVLMYYGLFRSVWKWGLILFFSAFLLLLSSKLVIIFYILLFLQWIITSEWGRTKAWFLPPLLLIPVVAGFFTRNPISERFKDVIKGDPELATRSHYDPSVYFNGVQFRLLQYRIVPAILNEQRSWIPGVGPDRAQKLINLQYRERNLYLGEGSDIGYRAFNTHNQALESLLRYGVIGLIGFLLVAFAAMGFVVKSKEVHWKIFLSLILLYAVLESVLETQYGIIIFTFLPVFIWCMQKEPTSPAAPNDLTIHDA